MTSSADDVFWEHKSLADLNAEEWEALCDGCAQCCLIKLEDEDTGELHLTRIACRLLDIGRCRCKDYDNRHRRVPGCVPIDAGTIAEIYWLPANCAYRLLAEGRPLAWWHPLVSGDPETVHQAGISIRERALSEDGVDEDASWRYIIRDPSG